MKKILIASVVLISVLFLIAFVYEALVMRAPTPSPIPTVIDQNAASGVSPPDEGEQETARREFIVGGLINILPHEGTGFSLSYDFSNDMFTLVLDQGAEDLGNRNFDAFLRENDIEDRGWIKNLRTTTRP